MAAVLVAAPLALAALPASARMDPAALRARMLASISLPYQGYAESTGSLGLPDLPNLSEVTSLLGGTTRLRSWYVDPKHWRVDEISGVGERDTYAVPGSQYVWDNGQNQYTQVVGDQPIRLPRGGDLLPPDLARRVLADEGKVVALPAERVAGIDAAGLRVTPSDPQTAIGHVDVWADPDTGLPLRVEVTAKGQPAPFVVTAFQSVSTQRPDNDVITPKPSPDSGFTATGAPDVVGALGQFPLPPTLAGRQLQTDRVGGGRGLGFYGAGLAAFAVVPLPRNVSDGVVNAIGKVGGKTVTLPGGQGTLLTIAPLSVLVERSYRRSFLIAGVVDPALLTQAAAELSTLPRRRP
ncbi:hypothetical protein JJ691_11130 [Kutzneria sp. CA-103260]|nr:hypothetical protein JJ691_11130 [Kutzneria sp. CA-103260]